MKKLLVTFIIAVILMTGCANRQDDTPSTTDETKYNVTSVITEAENESETEALDQNIVSPLAEKDYLTPFDKYSWEREFDIEYIVLHFTSDVVNSPDEPYNIDSVKNIFEQTEVSTHYIIDRDGSIKCYIPENYAAWHSGVGTYADDEKYTNKMNKYSIGIELLGIGSESDMKQFIASSDYQNLDKSLVGFTDEQYSSLKSLLEDICLRNSVEYDRNHIIGHSEYNPNKSDPGELFDWNRLFE